MNAKLRVLAAMLIFGSTGLFVRYIALPSPVIALIRGVVGCLFLLLTCLVLRRRIAWRAMWDNRWLLLLTALSLSLNWIFLFESYRFTTIACATLSYYFAPVFIVLLSPLVLKERLTRTKLLCCLCAVAGMVLVANVFGAAGGTNDLLGVGLGLAAAVCYAGIVLMIKFLRGLTAVEATIAQLAIASLLLIPYTLLTEDVPALSVSVQAGLLLLLMGVVHTGLAYLLSYSGIQRLPGQTVAILSYIDPLTAILLSALFLHERMAPLQVVGAVLILGATLLSELCGGHSVKNKDLKV